MKHTTILYMQYSVMERNTRVVFYDGKEVFVNASVEHILRDICMKYGSSFSQKRTFLKKKFKYKQKTPLLLDVHNESLFFPVYGDRCEERVWVSYRYVKCICTNEVQSGIVFTNQEVLWLPLHRRTLQKQVRRCKEIIKQLA